MILLGISCGSYVFFPPKLEGLTLHWQKHMLKDWTLDVANRKNMPCGLQQGLGPVHGSIEIGFWFSTSAHLVSLLQDLLLKTSSAAGAKLMAFFWGMGPFHARVDGEMLPFFRSRGRSKGGRHFHQSYTEHPRNSGRADFSVRKRGLWELGLPKGQNKTKNMYYGP